MNCPVCKDSVLAMTEKKGVEVDYCPTCRGVWLDRGELEKLTVISGETHSGQPLPRSPEYFREAPPVSDRNGYYKYKKKKSLFEELFD